MLICLTAPKWRRAIGLCALVCSAASWAQLAADDPDWKESEAPAPPTFELNRLVPFEVSPNSALKWGFDPETMKITKDGLVRYVVVAQSPSGVVNAMYEAVRCTTGEWKTYARYNKDSGWSLADQPQWRGMRGYQPSHHALRLAQQGMCSGSAPALSVREVVQSVRQQNVSKAR
jgi:hypothetical protein